MNTGTAATRARHIVRTRFSEYPQVYLPFARVKYPGPSPEVISDATELVVDGYTRSASTFAVYALQLAQDRPVRMAHHLHAPAQLVEGARRGLPSLLVIREPRGAILSQMVREPGVALRDALVAYIRFHAKLLPYRDSFVVGEFEEITHDFGVVIRRLNARFDLDLAEPRPGQAEECFAFIAQRARLSPVLLGFESGTASKEAALTELERLSAEPSTSEQRETWVPSDERRRAKEALAAQWNRKRYARLRQRAQEMYETFTADRDAVTRSVEQTPAGELAG